MTLFAPAARIPPPGCTVRTIEGGVAKITQSEPKSEEVMPRGVYERKPRAPKDEHFAAVPDVRKVRKIAPKPSARFRDVLMQLRVERDAINTAIEALESII